MKLWQKQESIDKIFERFTVGKDPELDIHLAKYDVIGSKAHVKMLGEIGLLESEEVIAISLGLEKINQMIDSETFEIREGVEDCHSQIEILLIEELGPVGKKIPVSYTHLRAHET